MDPMDDHSIERATVAERDGSREGGGREVSALVDVPGHGPLDAPDHRAGPLSGPLSGSEHVVQDAPGAEHAALRRDFGAHFEANYQRLVAQLYAITLDSGEAHDAVQDAYSRAWRRWAEVGSSPDPTAWVRRVAVRMTTRSWRRRLRRSRPPAGGTDERSSVLLRALGTLPASERRCAVLYHMAGASVAEIASVEGVPAGTASARLRRAQQVLGQALDALPAGWVDEDDEGDQR
jgi:DNA-directed RNA polymerase specialized sigma24 family protein